jgi:hypothetical protein
VNTHSNRVKRDRRWQTRQVAFSKKSVVNLFAGILFLFAQCVFSGTRNGALPNSGSSYGVYHLVEGWAKLPAGRAWGDLGSITVDRHNNVWTIDKCGSNNCAGSSIAPILEFDTSGKLIRSIGAGLMIFPHALYVDKEDNVWVVDERTESEKELAENPAGRGLGAAVLKFSPEGKLLMTLGTPGVAGDPPQAFSRPSSVVVNSVGEIFVADGYPSDSNKTARIVKFSREGKFLRTWGTRGSGPGEFEYPHSLAMDSIGRLFVADRDNKRIQIFDAQGKYLAEWKQFGDPTSVFIDARDRLYVSATALVGDSLSDFPPGIRVGSAKDGSVGAFIPARSPEGKDHLGRSFAGAEGVAADAMGNVYATESKARHLLKYSKTGE